MSPTLRSLLWMLAVPVAVLASYVITAGVGFEFVGKEVGSLDFDEINDGTCADETVMVPGAATGDFVVLAQPVLASGVEVHVHASGSNEVTVTLCNNTGMSYDAPAMTEFGVMVLR